MVLNLTLPAPGADEDVWGGVLNAYLTGLNQGKADNTALSQLQTDETASLNGRVLNSVFTQYQSDLANTIAGLVVKADYDTYKSQVSISIQGKAPLDHEHNTSQITTGTLDPARIGLGAVNQFAVRNAAGILVPVTLSSSATTGTAALRGTGGTVAVGTPTDATHAVTKSYADALVSGVSPVQDRGEAFTAVAKLGSRDAICTLWSDSTGNENIEWFRLMVNDYAALHPKARVLYYPWDDATKQYLSAAVVQSGATSTATTKPLVDTFSRTVADLKGSVTDTGQVWGGDTNATGDWSADGNKLVRTTDSTFSATAVDAGVPGDHRLLLSGISLDTTPVTATKAFIVTTKRINSTNYLAFELRATTGAGITGYIHKMINGSYTTVATKTSAFTAGVTTFDLDFKLVGTTLTATFGGNTLTGTLTADEAAAVAQGSSISLSATGSLSGMTIAGLELEVTGTGLPAQTLSFYCGALSGSSLDYQVSNVASILPANTDVLILSSVHNNGSMLGAEFVTKLENVVNVARAQAPKTGIIVSSQNPQKSPATGVVAHYARNVAVAGAAAARGWGYLPVFEAFAARADAGWSYVKNIDGVHPTTSADVANPNNGSSLWAQVALDYFIALEQVIPVTKAYVDSRVVTATGTATAPAQYVIYEASNGTYPNRPNQSNTITVDWRGPDAPPSGNGTHALRGVDTWLATATVV